MKTVYLLALGLVMTGHAFAASITGSISVKLTIHTQCSIDGSSLIISRQPDIACGAQPDAQPKITQSVIAKRTTTDREARLVTVEW